MISTDISQRNAAQEARRMTEPAYGPDFGMPRAAIAAPSPNASAPTSGAVRAPLTTGSAEADAKYRIIEKLGRGSQGEVFHARRRSDGKDVAIKVLHIHSVKDWKQYELFRREAETLKRLDVEGVAHLCETIEELETADPVSVIVQDYICGYSLNKYIQAGRRFGIGEISDIIIQLLGILQALHNRPEPIIHRDIKPSNIMLVDEQGHFRVYLIDFGAVANPQVKEGGSTVAGTYGYMPPEQLMGYPVPESDIYAVGAVALYLFSGQSPESMEMQDFRYMIDPCLQHLPYAITVLLRNMLEPNVRDRIADIATIRSAFEAIKKSNFGLLQEIVGAAQKQADASQTEFTSYRQGGAIGVWSALSDCIPRSGDIPQTVLDGLARIHPKMASGEKFLLGKNGELRLSQYTQPYCADDVAAVLSELPFKRRPNVRSVEKSRSAMLLKWLISSVLAFVASFVLLKSVVRGNVVSVVLCQSFAALSAVAGAYCMFMFLKRINATENYVRDHAEKIAPMFRYGRKTLAAVSKIEYAIDPKVYASIEQPLWRISYKFNPVDDESPEDLERSFYTRLPPDDLQVGDFIPCLYIIAREDGETEYVYSIPWPVLSQDDIYLCGDAAKLLSRDKPLAQNHIQNII